MSEHKTTAIDGEVRGYPGTIATCLCGWREAWGVQDGSAESDAHQHMMDSDPEYKSRYVERVAQRAQELNAQGCTCKKFTEDFGFVLTRECPLHDPPRKPQAKTEHRKLCHSCTCFIDPPCGNCVSCAHVDHPECENDCQTCDLHEDGESDV